MLWALNKVANSVDHDHTAAVQSDQGLHYLPTLFTLFTRCPKIREFVQNGQSLLYIF